MAPSAEHMALAESDFPPAHGTTQKITNKLDSPGEHMAVAENDVSPARGTTQKITNKLGSPAASTAGVAEKPLDSVDKMGWFVIAGAIIYKLPQILKVHRAQSSAGLSLLTNAAEMISYSVAFAYSYSEGHPFSTYGETAFQGIGSAVLVNQILTLQYRVALRTRCAWGSVYLLGFVVLCHARRWMSATFGRPLRYVVKAFNMLVSLLSKGPQILVNFNQGTVGEQSKLTTSLTLLGSTLRVYTILRKLAGDPLMVTSQFVSFFMNFTLSLQIFLMPKDK